MAQRLGAGQPLQRGGQPRVHADQRAAIGLVLAMLAGVGRAGGELAHRGRDVHQDGGDRQLGAELVHLGQVVAQRGLALLAQRELQRVGGDVGVAVAVAADPVAHAKERRDLEAGQRLLDLAVHARDLAQERGVVVADRVLDLVGHGELGVAQQARLPELRDARTQLPFVVLALALGAQLVALVDQRGHGALGVQDGLALHLRGVGGEHRRDVGLRQGLRDVGGADVVAGQPLEAHRQRAFLQVALALVMLAPAHVVAVLGDVGKVREVAEGANHADRLVTGEILQQAIERAAGLRVALEAIGHRQLPDALDQLEGLLAVLLADHVAQDAPEEADVLDQRAVLLDGIIAATACASDLRGSVGGGAGSGSGGRASGTRHGYLLGSK